MTSRMNRTLLALAAVGSLATGLVASSQAASPESGTVSAAAPKVNWEGTVQSSGIFYMAWDEDPEIPCDPPACDPFMLKVDGAHSLLTVSLNVQNESAAGGEGGGGLRIKLPSGEYNWVKGTSGPKTALRVKLKNPAPGDYEVTSVASYICCGPSDYLASAEVPGGAPAPAPAPATGAPAPSASPEPAPSITVKAGKLSAKKLKKAKKFTVALSSNGQVNKLKASFRKGKKAIGAGTLASLNGSGKLTIKIAKKAAKKLKKGTYSFSVSGTDSQGRTVGTSLRLKVVK